MAETECLFTDAPDRHTIGKQGDPLQIHRLARLHGSQQAGRALGLDTDHLDLRQQLLDVDGHTCGQTTTAHRQEDMGQTGILLQQLTTYGALTGNHIRIIKGRDQGVAVQFGETTTLGIGLVEVVTEQHHIAAKPTHRIHFDIRCSGRHDDGRLDAKPGTGERHALGMVASRSGDNAMATLLLIEAGNLVVSSAQLEGVDRLQILSLERHMVAQAVGELLQNL